jgi:hypothetical protein
MAYQTLDYSSFVDEESKNPPSIGGQFKKLIFPLKDKKTNAPYPVGKHLEGIILRILPAGTGKEATADRPWKTKQEHYLPSTGKFVPCKASKGSCEYCSAGLKARTSYMVNVLVLANPYNDSTVGEVLTYDLNEVLYGELYRAMIPLEEGEPERMPFDLIKGNDFRMTGTVTQKQGNKPFVNWDASRFEKKATRIAFLRETDDGDLQREPLTDEQIEMVLEKRQDIFAGEAARKPAEKARIASSEVSGSEEDFPPKRNKPPMEDENAYKKTATAGKKSFFS